MTQVWSVCAFPVLLKRYIAVEVQAACRAFIPLS